MKKSPISNNNVKNVQVSEELDSAGQYSTVKPKSAVSSGVKNNVYNMGLMAEPNRSEKIVPALIEYISATGLEAGDKLPPEKKLCELHGVGGRSLREALISLKALGLVQSQHGTGWFVEEFQPSSSLLLLAPLFRDFSGADAYQVMQMRLIMEPLATRMAAENIGPEGLDRLSLALEMMKKNAGDEDVEVLRENDRRFHDVLAQESGNCILAMMVSILSGLFYVVLWKLPTLNNQPVIGQHQRIFDAIKAGDGETAEKEALLHLQEALFCIKKYENV